MKKTEVHSPSIRNYVAFLLILALAFGVALEAFAAPNSNASDRAHQNAEDKIQGSSEESNGSSEETKSNHNPNASDKASGKAHENASDNSALKGGKGGDSDNPPAAEEGDSQQGGSSENTNINTSDGNGSQNTEANGENENDGNQEEANEESTPGTPGSKDEESQNRSTELQSEELQSEELITADEYLLPLGETEITDEETDETADGSEGYVIVLDQPIAQAAPELPRTGNASPFGTILSGLGISFSGLALRFRRKTTTPP